MTVACPNGHQSEMTDYCDQCGAKMAGTPGQAPSVPAIGTQAPATGSQMSAGTQLPAGSATGQAGPGGQLCPACNVARIADDRFCEGCGYDFTTGAGPGPQPADSPTGEAAWEAIVNADRAYYDRVAPEGVEFPALCPSRHFLLVGDQIRIGRHSASRGVQAEVDLTGAPEDTAISHLHSLLIAQPDGSYSLIDPGSTNGTTLNDDPTPLAANVAVPLVDGDQIHLGAWTTITVRARPASTR